MGQVAPYMKLEIRAVQPKISFFVVVPFTFHHRARVDDRCVYKYTIDLYA